MQKKFLTVTQVRKIRYRCMEVMSLYIHSGTLGRNEVSHPDPADNCSPLLPNPSIAILIRVPDNANTPIMLRVSGTIEPERSINASFPYSRYQGGPLPPVTMLRLRPSCLVSVGLAGYVRLGESILRSRVSSKPASLLRLAFTV